MGAFDHVLVLLSFVYALALTHLLSRAGGLLLARKRVQFSALQALSMLNAIATVYCNWLITWDLRSVTTWEVGTITILFSFAVSLYFFCSVAAPEAAAEGPIDLEAFYWENRKPYWGLFALCMALVMGANFAFLKTPTPALFMQTNVGTLPFFAPPALALFVSARWAQWVAGVALFGMTAGFTIWFSGTLG